MDPITIALILGAISLAGTIGTTIYTNKKQEQRDIAADERALENQKAIMDYQANQTQSINTMATQKGFATDAGYSPALLYGSMSTPQLYDGKGGSAQGTSSEVKMPEVFNRLDPNNVYESVVTSRDQEMRRQQVAADVLLKNKEGLLADARTAEQLRNTGLLKNMEKTLMSQMRADLALTRSQSSNLDFLTRRGEFLLPGELEQQGIINQQQRKKIEEIDSNIRKNAWEMRQISADIKRINAVTSLTGEQQNYTAEQTRGVIESTRNSAIGRIMREFGLNERKSPTWFRSADWLHNKAYQQQMQNAVIELKNLGFSEHEAVNAVVYYVASDPKDVTPSLVNGVSRVLSTAIKE